MLLPPAWYVLTPVTHCRLTNVRTSTLVAITPITAAQRLACILVKFCEYSLAGMACGFVGQGIANSLMLLK